MTVTLQNLRAVGVGVEPTSLLPGQIAFNVTDKVIYVGDGSSLRTSFLGTTSPGTPGGGWFAMPMDFDFLNTYFLANPELYGDIPTDGQVVTWSTPLNRPIWTSSGSGGANQAYTTTNSAVAVAPGATLSDKISAAIGVASPDEGNTVIVTGVPGEVYQGLYIFITSWVRAAYYAYPTASAVVYSNTLSGLSAITVQQAIDEVDGLVNVAQSTANTAVADAAAAQVLANAALPRTGGTMTGAITFAAGQTFPVSGIQDASATQKGVVQGGTNMTFTSPGVIDVRAASTTVTGIVQLSDSTTSPSSTLASTAAAANNLQNQINGLSIASNVILAGTLDCSTGLVDSVTSQGTAQGFVVGAPLPAAAGRTDYYVIVSDSGVYNPPGGGGPYNAESGDWFLSNGTTWQYLGVGARPTYATTTVAGIVQLADNPSTQAGSSGILAVTPSGLQSKLSDSVVSTSSTFIASSAAVKTAYDRGVTAETNSIPKTTVSAKGTIVTGTAANTPAALPVGSNGQILSVNSACSTGLEWISDSPGDVTSVSGTAPITVNNFNPETPIVGISQATSVSQGSVQIGSNIDVALGVISVKSSTTGQAGVVQLEDTTSSTSTVLALTANQGYSLQQQINALAISNNITLAGTIDGSTGFMITVTTEGTAKGFTVGAALPAPVPGNSEYFAIVTVPGTMTPPGGAAQAVNDGDWWLSNGTVWQYLPVGYSGVYATTTVPGVVQLSTDAQTQAGTDTTVAVVPSSLQSKMSDSTSTTSSTTIASSTAVKSAYDLADAAVPKSCYTALGALAAGTGASTVGTLALGTNGQFLAANNACSTGVQWCTISLACVPCSAFTASGQLLAGTGTSTFTALTVGSNNQILVADSACTGGLKWFTSPGAFFCGYTCTATPFNTALGALAGDSITTGVNNTAIGYNSGTAITGGLNNTFVGFDAGDGITSADNNVAVGSRALSNTGGNNNTAVGYCTGAGLSSGGSNTFIGGLAGYRATTLDNAVAVGYGAMGGVATGTGQVAVGSNALCSLTSGAGNVAVGFNAATAITTGANNTILGFNAGDTISTGTQNTFLGACSGGSLAGTSEGNTGIGFSALGQGVTSGAYNVAIGNCAGLAVTSGALNTLVGYTAGSAITTGGSNTLIGRYIGTSTLANNVVLSDGAGTIRFQSNSTGAISLGTGGSYGTAGQVLASQGSAATPVWCSLALACVPCAAFTAPGELLAGTGSSTFASLPVGTNGQVLSANSAFSAGLEWCTLTLACVPCSAYTAVGTILAGNGAGTYCSLPIGTNGQALVPNSACAAGVQWVTCQGMAICGYTCTATPFNTALGANAGDSVVSGTNNTNVGYNAGTALTSGGGNTFVGSCAGDSAITADNSVAVGLNALTGAVTANGTIAIGSGALVSMTSGAGNVGIGYQALDTLITGGCNTAVGFQTGTNVATNVSGNTLIGYQAGLNTSSGSQNTFVGNAAGSSVTTGANNTILGNYNGIAALSGNVVLSTGAGNIRFQSNSSGAWSYDGTNFGTSGQVLKSAGTAAAPAWSSALYGAFSSSVTQTNTGGASGNAVTVSTVSSSNGFSAVSGSQITATTAGVYNIQISLQVEKTDAGIDSMEIWFKKNGTDIANSNTNIELRGGGAKELFALNLVEPLTAGEYLEVWWYSADANVQLTAVVAGTRPAIPSAIITVVPVGA